MTDEEKQLPSLFLTAGHFMAYVIKESVVLDLMPFGPGGAELDQAVHERPWAIKLTYTSAAPASTGETIVDERTVNGELNP